MQHHLTSEIEFQRVIPDVQRLSPQNVYLGVGPEQNFTYIVAFKPSMAFIVDIRKGNLLLHLTYKALVETSSNRVEFLSRLFARQQPSGVGPTPQQGNSSVRFEPCAFPRMPRWKITNRFCIDLKSFTDSH
jgi:hypothetical protein